MISLWFYDAKRLIVVLFRPENEPVPFSAPVEVSDGTDFIRLLLDSNGSGGVVLIERPEQWLHRTRQRWTAIHHGTNVPRHSIGI